MGSARRGADGIFLLELSLSPSVGMSGNFEMFSKTFNKFCSSSYKSMPNLERITRALFCGIASRPNKKCSVPMNW